MTITVFVQDDCPLCEKILPMISEKVNGDSKIIVKHRNDEPDTLEEREEMIEWLGRVGMAGGLTPAVFFDEELVGYGPTSALVEIDRRLSGNGSKSNTEDVSQTTTRKVDETGGCSKCRI